MEAISKGITLIFTIAAIGIVMGCVVWNEGAWQRLVLIATIVGWIGFFLSAATENTFLTLICFVIGFFGAMGVVIIALETSSNYENQEEHWDEPAATQYYPVLK